MRNAPPTAPGITLAHPAFAGMLALLLANDLVLKAAYPGWLTGKLSDFAGLFVLPFFLAWLWPARRSGLHVAVALAFVAWKLPVSRPFVELWNAAPWFDIARVEDLTDLVALPCVLASYLATARAPSRIVHWPDFALASVALLAFAATSKREFFDLPLRGSFVHPGDFAALRRDLQALDHDLAWTDARAPGGRGQWSLEVASRTGDTCEFVFGIELSRFDGGMLLTLQRASGACDGEPADSDRVVDVFVDRIALPAHLRPVTAVASWPKSNPEPAR